MALLRCKMVPVLLLLLPLLLLTATRADAAGVAPTCSALHKDTALHNSAAMKGSVSGGFAGDAGACCKLCSGNEGCAAITWFKGTCFLHPTGKPTGPYSHAEGKTSGIVRPGTVPKPAPLPPPPPPPPPQPIKPAPKGAKNVLFLISDDLRPEMLEAYGQQQMITPHFDKLAKESLVLNRAYCQQAICGPTRNSFLSGRRPQRTQAWNFIDHFREPKGGKTGHEPARTEDGGLWVSLPGYFKTNGYITMGGGKTYHPGLPPNNDGNLSWSLGEREYVNNGDKRGCTSDYFPTGNSETCPDNGPWDTSNFTDHSNLLGMLDDLRYASAQQKATGQPFFLNYGLHRPHLPFHVPASFPDETGSVVNQWEKYGPDEGIALPKHQAAPKDMPGIAFTYVRRHARKPAYYSLLSVLAGFTLTFPLMFPVAAQEMDGQTQVRVFGETWKIPGPDNPTDDCPFCGPALPDNATRWMRKGYYLAVTWIDFLAGQIIGELEALGHKEDTVIALVGDHGWQLGEHNIWGKHTNFELGTRVPLIFHAAGQTAGIKSNSLVESVDIYPTLAALAGLPTPPDVDGNDLSALIKDPQTQISEAVFSEYPRCAPLDAGWTPEPGHATPQSCVNTPRSNFTVMGYSVRTDDWRATFWMPWIGEKLAGDFEKGPAAVELYAHTGDTEADFDAFENENVASENAAVVAKHLAMATKQWKKKEY